MSVSFSKYTGFLCLSCGLEAEVVYQTIFRKWGRRVKYCPYCGVSFKEGEDTAIFRVEEGE